MRKPEWAALASNAKVTFLRILRAPDCELQKFGRFARRRRKEAAEIKGNLNVVAEVHGVVLRSPELL